MAFVGKKVEDMEFVENKEDLFDVIYNDREYIITTKPFSVDTYKEVAVLNNETKDSNVSKYSKHATSYKIPDEVTYKPISYSLQYYYNKEMFNLLKNYKKIVLTKSYLGEDMDQYIIDGSNVSHKQTDIVTKRLIYIDLDPAGRKSAYDSSIEKSYRYDQEMIEISQELGAYGVVFTGRGYHIYFMLDRLMPIEYIRDYYKQMASILGDRVKEKLYEKGIGDYYIVDPASFNYNQIFRMPLSFNSKGRETAKWLYKSGNFTSVYELLGFDLYDKQDLHISVNQIENVFKELKGYTINSYTDLFLSKTLFKKVIDIMSRQVYGVSQDLDKAFKCVLHKEEHPSASLSKHKHQLVYCDYHISKYNKSYIPNEMGKYKTLPELIVSYIENKNVLLTRDAKVEVMFMFMDVLRFKNKQFDKQKSIVINKLDTLQRLFSTGIKRKQVNRCIDALCTIVTEKLNQGFDRFMISQSFFSKFAQVDASYASKILNVFLTVGILKTTGIYLKQGDNYIEVSYEEYLDKYSDCYFTYIYEFNYNFDPYKVSEQLILLFKNHQVKYINVTILKEVFTDLHDNINQIIVKVKRVIDIFKRIHDLNKYSSRKKYDTSSRLYTLYKQHPYLLLHKLTY